MQKTRIFDPALGFAPVTDVWVATDSSVFRRDGRWRMALAGKIADREGIQIFSASLPPGAPLSAAGWTIDEDPRAPGKAAMLAPQEASKPWDYKGGRHCPSYVRGYDPRRRAWVERIYYAGGAENVWGPYTIGYLEWDGAQWVDQAAPVFRAEEEWERGSVFEPNLIYADGKWKMWHVAGSNREDYLVHGYAESEDGRVWTARRIFAPPEMKLFDFHVFPAPGGYDAVFSRVWMSPTEPPATTGLWWTHCATASPNLADWSEPVQILRAETGGWHGGPWKPSVQFSETDPKRLFVFFDGVYRMEGDSPFPFVFTLGCLEIDRPTA